MHDQPATGLSADARFGPDPTATFKTSLAQVEERIARACRRSGRDRAAVRLLPVSKTVPAQILRFAVRAGMHTFGENKVQEAEAKHAALADLALQWSLIGHLQSNKARHATRITAEFQALDSLRLAGILDRQLERADRFLDVYIQVNTSGEESKFGLQPDALRSFIDALAAFRHLRPRGLMTLALFSSDMEKVRSCFRLLRRLRDETVRSHEGVSGLSMGMSGDFETAIEEGATVVRVGQAIFGKRPTPDSDYWPGLISRR